MALPTAASSVALLDATDTILYHPGIQFVPLLMNTQDPTSPATKLYDDDDTTGDVLFPVFVSVVRSVRKLAELVVGSNAPALFSSAGALLSLPVAATSWIVGPSTAILLLRHWGDRKLLNRGPLRVDIRDRLRCGTTLQGRTVHDHG